MRILMMTPAFYPRVGGVERHVLGVGRALAARGMEVAVLTAAGPGDGPDRERVEGLEVVRFRPIALPASTRLRRGLMSRRLIRRADLVHCHDITAFDEFYWSARCLLPRRPAFITFHGFGRFPIPPSVLARTRRAADGTRGNICIGDFIPVWYPVRPTLVSYGAVEVPSHLAPVGSADLAFVGRLAEDTGIRVYLDAVRLLRERHHLDLSLSILGDGPLRAESERFAADHAIRATFHGFEPHPLPCLAGASAAFVSGYLAMLEAMALGKPVFAVYTHDLKRDYLRLSPFAEYAEIAGSAEELAEQIRVAWPPDPASPRLLAARRFALGQTWARLADTYLALYRRAGLAV